MAVQFQFKSGRALGFGNSLHNRWSCIASHSRCIFCNMWLNTMHIRCVIFIDIPNSIKFSCPWFQHGILIPQKKLRRTVLSLSLQSEPSGPVPSSTAPWNREAVGLADSPKVNSPVTTDREVPMCASQSLLSVKLPTSQQNHLHG